MRDLRERLSEAQNHRCAWNGCDLRYHPATLEHVVPVLFGGTSDPENLAVACARCNRLRGTLDQFRLYLATGKVKLTNSKRRRFIDWLEAFGEENFRLSIELAYGANGFLIHDRPQATPPALRGRSPSTSSSLIAAVESDTF